MNKRGYPITNQNYKIMKKVNLTTLDLSRRRQLGRGQKNFMKWGRGGENYKVQ